MSSTQEHLALMSHAQLCQRVKALSAEVHQDEVKHHQLGLEFRQAEIELRNAEQHALLANDELTRVALAEATDRLQAAREALRQHPAQGALKKVVLRQLGDELRSRESELTQRAREACREKWKAAGTPASYAATARQVVAQAALCDVHAATGDPAFISIEGYIATRLFPMECQRLVMQLVSEEMNEAKKKIVAESNGRFGS